MYSISGKMKMKIKPTIINGIQFTLRYILIFLLIVLCFQWLELQFLRLTLVHEPEVEYVYIPNNKYLKLEKALSEAAAFQYDKRIYNCVEFSNDLIKRLKWVGIKAEQVGGIGPEGGCHAWVAIWVEPQSGRFISPNEDYSRNSQCRD